MNQDLPNQIHIKLGNRKKLSMPIKRNLRTQSFLKVFNQTVKIIPVLRRRLEGLNLKYQENLTRLIIVHTVHKVQRVKIMLIEITELTIVIFL
jgi:hypothetical protein